MLNFLKKDNYILGAILGIVLPVLLYGLLLLVDSLLLSLMGGSMVEDPRYFYLLSTLINLYPIRVYLVSFKFEKSGKGVLLVSFIEIILYFLFFVNS